VAGESVIARAHLVHVHADHGVVRLRVRIHGRVRLMMINENERYSLFGKTQFKSERVLALPAIDQ
jgi:hypothetical protein